MANSIEASAFIEITDVRDGLSPSLRQMFSIVQATLTDNKFRRSSKVVQAVVDETGTFWEPIFDAMVDTSWPRCKLPLIDGHGNFGFPPSHPEFSEIRLSSFWEHIANRGRIQNFDVPLPMPVPYTLVAGTIGYCQSSSKIPTHNLSEVIDATIALIKNPELTTKDLLQYIKGPDLLVGGTIENTKDLPDIYQSGSGVIKIIVTPQTINRDFFGDVKRYAAWYGMKARKIRDKDAVRIEVPYHALLDDGTGPRLMSLKEILLSYINHFKTTKNISDDSLCIFFKNNKRELHW